MGGVKACAKFRKENKRKLNVRICKTSVAFGHMWKTFAKFRHGNLISEEKCFLDVCGPRDDKRRLNEDEKEAPPCSADAQLPAARSSHRSMLQRSGLVADPDLAGPARVGQ